MICGVKTEPFPRHARMFIWFAALAIGIAPLYGQTPPQDDIGKLALTLGQAVEIALAPDGNTRTALAVELVEQAEQRRAQSRAALLPNLRGALSQQSLVRNLEAFGIRIQNPIAGFTIPTVLGPFNVFDARLTASQTIFDLSAIRRYQAARTQAQAAREEGVDARAATTADVARAYVAAALAQQQLATAEANVALAESLLRLAQNRDAVGAGVRIEVVRAEVELADRRQKRLVASAGQRAAQMRLTRLLGLGIDRELELTTPLESPAGDTPAFDGALAEAFEHRADWRAQSLHEMAAQRADSATKWERLPSLTAFGDYGTVGAAINDARPTRTVGASLAVPLFDGGRREARRAESASQARQESIRTRDLRQQIELELRLSLDSLNSAALQTEVADAGLLLAEEEESRAQRRYEAGAGSSIEVTDAQTRLSRARQNRIEALGLYNLARIDWFEALGRIERVIP